jgi:hypothetical protein
MPYPVSDSVLFWIKTVHRAKVESIQRLRRAPPPPGNGTRATGLGIFDLLFRFFLAPS